MVVVAAIASPPVRGSGEQWRAVAEEIRVFIARHGTPGPASAWSRLYLFALAEARSALASFRLEPAEVDDLASDFLEQRLAEVVAEGNMAPRAVFRTAIVRWTLNVMKQRSREKLLERAGGDRAGPSLSEDDLVSAHDATAALAELGVRDRRILTAVWLGEDREEIARRWRVERSAIDKIASRFSLRLRKEGSR